MEINTAARPILIIGFGNPSRGDDALGPAALERLLAAAPDLGDAVEMLTDYQLQIEHALDLQNRDQVIFIDAAINGPEPYTFESLLPAQASTAATHELSPAALLSVYCRHLRRAPPKCWLLAIRGYCFELGESMSVEASQNLDAAIRFALPWIQETVLSNQVARPNESADADEERESRACTR